MPSWSARVYRPVRSDEIRKGQGGGVPRHVGGAAARAGQYAEESDVARFYSNCFLI